MSEAFIVRRGGLANAFAVIVVSYPEGSTCTCTNGTKTLKAKDTSGSYPFMIPEAGTWTVTATDGAKTASETVSITERYQAVSLDMVYGILYDAGDSHEEITGGWQPAWRGTFGTGALSLESDRMLISQTKIDYMRVRTGKKVCLKGSSAVNLAFTAVSGTDKFWRISINIGTDNVAVENANYVASTVWNDRVAGTRKTISVPIPEGTENEYITIDIIGISVFEVHKVWVD